MGTRESAKKRGAEQCIAKAAITVRLHPVNGSGSSARCLPGGLSIQYILYWPKHRRYRRPGIPAQASPARRPKARSKLKKTKIAISLQYCYPICRNKRVLHRAGFSPAKQSRSSEFSGSLSPPEGSMAAFCPDEKKGGRPAGTRLLVVLSPWSFLMGQVRLACATTPQGST